MRKLGWRFWHRLGRRGAALLFFAELDFVYAYSLLNPQPEAQQSASSRWIDSGVPLWVWGLAWLGTAVVCLVSAFLIRDKFAFACAIAIKLAWGSLFIAGGLAGAVPRAWLGAAVYLSLAAFVAVIASWPEPPPKAVVARLPKEHEPQR